MKESLDNPKNNQSRREFLKGVVGVAATLPLVATPAYGHHTESQPREQVPEPLEWADIIPDPVHSKEGYFVLVDDIMKQSIPTPDPMQILGTDTGLIISKRFHRFWLFDNGKLLREGPIGSANISDGRDTPEGKFDITRQEGENYSSREFPSSDPNIPNMPWASFFEAPRGIAIHGSLHFRTIRHPGTGVETEEFRLDASNGCVNVSDTDAELVHQTLGMGDVVVVLP